MHKILLTILLLAASATAPLAATDAEKLATFAHKFTAANVAAKARGLCVCQDGSSVNGVAGYLIAQSITSSITRVEVRCSVPTFSNAGDEISRLSCATFTAIGK